jgi:hypothetical protein
MAAFSAHARPPTDSSPRAVRAIAVIPEFLARVLYNVGTRAMNTNRLTTAARALHGSLACAPASAPTWLNLGNTYMAETEVELALGCFRKAAQLTPDSPLPHINVAIALLTLGQWEEGWKVYERRYDSEGFRAANGLKGGDASKMWRGESLVGKTLLLFNEQGAGDTIMCLRYALWTYGLSHADRVILRLPASLIRLARSTFGAWPSLTIVTDTEPLPPHDALAPYMSLPLRCGATKPEYVVEPDGYLKIYDTEPAHTFNPLLDDGLRVGLVWAGSPGHARDAERSIPLELFKSLLETPGISWVSLQVGPKAKEIQAFPNVRTVRMLDFYDTACVIKSLDLVISVDSSPCHLAGALGVPVWTLLPFAPDFRWMLKRADTPWYSSMTLYRQTTRGDWPDVIQRVRSALTTLSQRQAA